MSSLRPPRDCVFAPAPALAPPFGASSVALLALNPLAFVAAALLCKALLPSAPPIASLGLAQPLSVATLWGDFGRLLWVLTCACIMLAAYPYVAFLRGILAGTMRAPRLRVVIGISAVSLAAALTAPVIFSSDVYAYAAYGLLDAHGLSPYAHTFIALHDPLLRSAIWQWSNPLPICVYGPLFVWIAKVGVLGSAPFGPSAQLFVLRLIASLALVASGPLMYLAFRGLSHAHRIAAVAGVVLNPVIIWTAAEGHNDTLVLAVVLAGFIMTRRFGYLTGALIIASSALIKASGAAAAAILALYAWPQRSRFLKILVGSLGGLTLTAIIARPFESGISTVLIPHGHYLPQFSLQFAGAQVAHSMPLGIAIAVVASGALALHGARLALRGDRQGAAYIALGLWLLIPNPYPWYALWILPVAFLCLGTPVSWAIIASSLTIFVRYLPEVSSAANPDVNLAVTVCELGLPLAILAHRWMSFPQRAPEESDPSAL